MLAVPLRPDDGQAATTLHDCLVTPWKPDTLDVKGAVCHSVGSAASIRSLAREMSISARHSINAICQGSEEKQCRYVLPRATEPESI
jgi:hypothetical protein